MKEIYDLNGTEFNNKENCNEINPCEPHLRMVKAGPYVTWTFLKFILFVRCVYRTKRVLANRIYFHSSYSHIFSVAVAIQ